MTTGSRWGQHNIKAEADAREREHLMSRIESIETSETKTKDKGGWTVIYIHRVKMKSGTILEFIDRNAFELCRLINPNYPILDGMKPGGIYTTQEDGSLMWECFVHKKGFVPVRPLTEDETFAVLAISKYFGYHTICL